MRPARIQPLRSEHADADLLRALAVLRTEQPSIAPEYLDARDVAIDALARLLRRPAGTLTATRRRVEQEIA
jgi:hypothetical protein